MEQILIEELRWWGVLWWSGGLRLSACPAGNWIPGQRAKISWWSQPGKKKQKTKQNKTKTRNSINFRGSNTGVNNDEMEVSILPRGKRQN